MQVFKRLLHCVSCGNRIELALEAASKYAPLDLSESKDARIEKTLQSSLSEPQLQNLQWSQLDEDKASVGRRELARIRAHWKLEKARKSNICPPCTLNKNGSSTVLKPSSFNVFEYFKQLKLGSKYSKEDVQMVHVIDAHDFPTGVPLEYRPGDLFVVNRADLVSPASSLQQLKSFYMRACFNAMGVAESNVVVSSVPQQWNLKAVGDKLRKLNVFVGATNAGKTALVNKLAGIDHRDLKKRSKNASTSSPSTWPVPYTTQTPREVRSLAVYSSHKLVDTPSVYRPSYYPILSSKAVRKVGAGTEMLNQTYNYAVPVIRMSAGQVATVGGLFALEFPKLLNSEGDSVTVHVHVGVGGVAHSKFANNFRSMDKVVEMNNRAALKPVKTANKTPKTELDLKNAAGEVITADPQLPDTHFARMHTVPGLQIEKIATFKPGQTLAVHGLGFVHPHIFANVPPEYEISVYAPPDLASAFQPREDLGSYLKKSRSK